MPALAMAIQLLTQLPGLIAAGVQVKGLIDSTRGTLEKAQAEGRDPTDAEWDALNKTVEELRKQL